ncbi:hypothetical protein AMQ84_27175 [Paenibacillus riograndensis]|uniref:Uncharacterized protein n=1 Tax=Paenibacillus riograndensis TaxID=483937 RepID=A0A132TJR4_9BACL|nr:hypothetical protein [Paenibacillus riograndensis]KWX71607.1 hypothetical protein AMQ84_27175 [Paenibacillus riograndensis]
MPENQNSLEVEQENAEEQEILTKGNEELELFGSALRPFCTNDVAYAAIRSVVIGKVYSLMDIISDLQAQAETADEEARKEIAELSAQIEERDTIVTGLKQDLYESQLLAEDNANKRDAAHRELLEAKTTIDALNDKLAAATVSKPKERTNVEGDNSVELFKQSLPAIYDVQDHPTDNRKYIAKLAETDEPVEGLWIYKNGKHREVTAEEAPTFRAEYLAKQEEQERDHADHTHDIPENSEVAEYTVPTFQTYSATGGLDQINASVEMAGKTVEERLQALELAVFGKAEVEAA